MAMDAELKEKWVAALRSGKYKQAREQLRTTRNGYCCLGVLCDVLGEKWEKQNNGKWSIGGRDEMPPNVIQDLIGSNVQATELADKNDSGDDFDTIADYIDANL